MIATLVQICLLRSNPMSLSTAVTRTPISRTLLQLHRIQVVYHRRSIRWCARHPTSYRWKYYDCLVIPSWNKGSRRYLGAHYFLRCRSAWLAISHAHLFRFDCEEDSKDTLMGQNRHDRHRSYRLQQVPSSHGVLPSVLEGVTCHVWCGPVGIRSNSSGSSGGQNVTGTGRYNPTCQARNS